MKLLKLANEMYESGWRAHARFLDDLISLNEDSETIEEVYKISWNIRNPMALILKDKINESKNR